MKIGIFTDTYSPSVNETTIIIEDLIRNIEKKGHKVTVVTASHNEVVGEETNVIRLSKEIDLGGHNVANIIRHVPANDKKQVLDAKFDIVHTFGTGNVAMFGKSVAAKLNVPYVCSVLRDDELAYRVAKEVEGKKVSVVRIKKINYIEDSLLSKAGNIISYYGEYTNVAFGLDVKAFAKTSEEDVEKTLKNMKIKSKNIHLLIADACDNINAIVEKFKTIIDTDKKVALVVVGAAAEVDDAYKGNIFYVPDTSKLDVFYRSAKALVYATSVKSANVYCAMAMAMGLPVLALDSENIKEVFVDRKNGLVFHNIDELEDMVKILAKDKSVAASVEKHTLGAAKKHSSTEHAKTMETIYLKAIRNKNNERKNDIYKNRKHRRKMVNK